MPDQATNPSGPAPATPPQIDNPPAFPSLMVEGWSEGSPCMTLRDYFAGQALAGLVTGNVRDCMTGDNAAERYAGDAYCIADAMLAERAKRGA